MNSSALDRDAAQRYEGDSRFSVVLFAVGAVAVLLSLAYAGETIHALERELGDAASRTATVAIENESLDKRVALLRNKKRALAEAKNKLGARVASLSVANRRLEGEIARLKAGRAQSAVAPDSRILTLARDVRALKSRLRKLDVKIVASGARDGPKRSDEESAGRKGGAPASNSASTVPWATEWRGPLLLGASLAAAGSALLLYEATQTSDAKFPVSACEPNLLSEIDLALASASELVGDATHWYSFSLAYPFSLVGYRDLVVAKAEKDEKDEKDEASASGSARKKTVAVPPKK